MPLLRIQDLRVTFPGQAVPAVGGISLDIERGQWVALVGESGSGKSVTALSTLRLLSTPKTEGSILLERGGATADLTRVDARTLRRIRGAEVSMIFQEPMTSLNPVYTCGEQIAETLRLHKRLSRPDARRQTIAALEEVLLPDPAAIYHRYPHQLSGGQKQRVMIAMAVCCRPGLLIADEPTTALDVTVQHGIVQLLRGLQRERDMAILFITHDLGLVREAADRALILYRGRLLEEGAVPAVFDAPHHPYTRALLACRPANTPKGQRLPVVEDFWRPDADAAPSGSQAPPSSARAATADPLTPASAARPTPFTPAATTARAGHPPLPGASASTPVVLLRVENLRVHFPGRTRSAPVVKAVDDVSFDVREGEILGLVGESGSGKTTIGRALLRLVPVNGGRILYKGQDMKALKPSAFRHDLQIVFQDPYSALNPRMTLGQTLKETLKKARSTKTPGYMLDLVRLPATFAERYPHECSGGQRQRAVIARALAMAPAFVLFDESVSALDVSVQAQILNLIGDLKQQLGFTAVFISHDLAVVRYLCDRMVVLKAGRIEEMGDAEQIYRHPSSAYTRNLLEAIPRA